MPTVDVLINQRPYTVACDIGEEERVRELARAVDRRLAGMGRGAAGENQLLVLVSLMMADEIDELRGQATAEASVDEAGAVAALDALAARIEAVADRLGAA